MHHGRPRHLALKSDWGWGVRVLLATTARDDHLGTLVVFGIACHRFRHEVVAAPELFAAAVQRAGFAHAPFATPVPAVRDAATSTRPTPSPDRTIRQICVGAQGQLMARG
jgi:hypothetical protein